MANATAGASHIISFYKANPLTQPLTHITLSLSPTLHANFKTKNKEQEIKKIKELQSSEALRERR